MREIKQYSTEPKRFKPHQGLCVLVYVLISVFLFLYVCVSVCGQLTSKYHVGTETCAKCQRHLFLKIHRIKKKKCLVFVELSDVKCQQCKTVQAQRLDGLYSE